MTPSQHLAQLRVALQDADVRILSAETIPGSSRGHAVIFLSAPRQQDERAMEVVLTQPYVTGAAYANWQHSIMHVTFAL